MGAKKDRKKRPKRNEDKRQLRRYLIVSEDAKSSLDYFRAFPVDQDLVKIVSKGGAGDTRSVVERAITLRNEAQRAKKPYAHVFCVFDRDDHKLERYQAAFGIASSPNDITAIWANECYELWLMLHYQYRNTRVKKEEILCFLNKKFPKGYAKGSSRAYYITIDYLENAMRNSKKLLAQAEDPRQPWLTNPSTNIHVLVEKLIELKKL